MGDDEQLSLVDFGNVQLSLKQLLDRAQSAEQDEAKATVLSAEVIKQSVDTMMSPVQRSALRRYKLLVRAVLIGSVWSVLTATIIAQELVDNADEPQKVSAPSTRFTRLGRKGSSAVRESLA